jgi:putative membrane protein
MANAQLRNLGLNLYSEVDLENAMNRLLSTLFVIAFAAAMTLTSAVAQQDKDANGTAMSGKNSAGQGSSDTAFVKKAAQGGLAEVELGQLATQKAASEDVKKFGQRMVDDHSKANDQLKQVAQQQHIDIPTELNAKDKATKAKLEKLSGEQFDRAYMKDMVQDHRKDVSEFERASKTAKDPAVKSFAEQTLPTLREHLKEAQKIAPTQQKTSAPSGQ